MFAITNTERGARGFMVTFANGWRVSVQFGKHNYCENREMSPILSGRDASPERGESKNAEIAAIPPGYESSKSKPCDGWHVFENGDTVKGWCSPEEVLAFMVMVAAKPACPSRTEMLENLLESFER